MPSTFTTNKKLEKPAYNSYIDDWNTPLNSDFDYIDVAFGGTTSLNVTAASGTVVLTDTQYRAPIWLVSGTLTANVTYQIASGVGGIWVVNNTATGAFTLAVSSGGGGTTATIPASSKTFIYSDGTNVVVSGGTAAGATTQVQYNSAGVLAGSASFVFDGTNVGINTTSPGSRLDVKGTLRLSGSTSGYVGLSPAAAAGSTTYTLPTADGAAGQFLTTNGGGTLSWSGVTTGVSSFSAGTTGLTPSTATTGAVTLAGTLAVANGGTGATTAANARTNLNVPTRTGGDASGTWSISISGNAATATSATSATSATTATTATTANALNTSNDYQVNSIGVGTAASGSAGEIRATGNVTAYYSDDRLKRRLGYIGGALDKVMSLRGFYYEANEVANQLGYESVREVGLSAQEVQAVLPEIVKPAPIDPQYLTLDYAKLVPLLVEAIKEQQILISNLSKKVNG